MGTARMDDDQSWANTRMSAVQSPASISQREQRRDTRAQLLRVCSLLGLALVIALAALFLTEAPQDSRLSTQARPSTIGLGPR